MKSYAMEKGKKRVALKKHIFRLASLSGDSKIKTMSYLDRFFEIFGMAGSICSLGFALYEYYVTKELLATGVLFFGSWSTLTLVPCLISFKARESYVKMLDFDYEREKETITVLDNGIAYGYASPKELNVGKIYTFNFDDIKNYIYNKDTKMLRIEGEGKYDTYENGEVKSSTKATEVEFFDIYPIDVFKLLTENCNK